MIDIQKLILKLRKIERITYNPAAGYENDVEHSFSLAMMAWLFGPKLVPHLDQFKLVTYAMVHDLVEVYAGDTFCFGSKEDLASKDAREQEALERLVVEYADFENLATDLEGYAQQDNEESRFIYALDKMQGVILNYLDGGRVWQENNITLEHMVNNKLEKTKAHAQVYTYMQQMAEVLAKEPELFPVISSRMFKEEPRHAESLI